MRDLQSVVKTALDRYPASPWIPKVARLLAEYRQLQLLHRVGIEIEDYGTYRLLTGSRSSTRRVFESVPIGCTKHNSAGNRVVLIEILPDSEQRKYRLRGLSHYSEYDLARSPILECFRDALLVLNLIPDVAESLSFLVKVCHLLKPDDARSDISYSDPDIPFSIWLSIPSFRVANDSLRMAESILHESMHLQLTLIEEVLPLVNSHEQTFFSPWKGAYRPSYGLLHSVYVFQAIDKFYEQLLSTSTRSVDDTRYMIRRRKRIGREISQCRAVIRYSDFTDIGRILVQRLLVG